MIKLKTGKKIGLKTVKKVFLCGSFRKTLFLSTDLQFINYFCSNLSINKVSVSRHFYFI